MNFWTWLRWAGAIALVAVALLACFAAGRDQPDSRDAPPAAAPLNQRGL